MEIVKPAISENVTRFGNAVAVRTYGNVKRIFYAYPQVRAIVCAAVFLFFPPRQRGEGKEKILFLLHSLPLFRCSKTTSTAL